jgi:hypothetical protein
MAVGQPLPLLVTAPKMDAVVTVVSSDVRDAERATGWPIWVHPVLSVPQLLPTMNVALIAVLPSFAAASLVIASVAVSVVGLGQAQRAWLK